MVFTSFGRVIQNTITKVPSNGMEKTCCYAGAKKVTTGIFCATIIKEFLKIDFIIAT